MNALRFLVALVVLSGAVACSKNKSSAPPFAFNRPEHLGFVCLDPTGNKYQAGTSTIGTKKHPPLWSTPLLLPLRCCADQAGFNKADPLGLYKYDWNRCPHVPDHQPILHALVTQSTRGEVAAVDLVGSKVIDSDPRVPGYTFVDVGGLPSAIVVPPEKPRARGSKESTTPEGPRWTYVTSAEELYIRAISTCRFRSDCRPDESSSPHQLQLPSVPHDMVLIDDALWLALPDLGAIARITLPSDETPFKLDPKTKKPIPPTYFAVAPIGPAMPKAPEHENIQYLTACGLGYVMDGAPHAPPVKPSSSDPNVQAAYEAALKKYEANLEAINRRLRPLELPNAPVMVPTLGPHPTRMRYDPTSKLLFVADREQPAVRAYSIDDNGKLVPRGVLLTGAPVRDFALTPAVPTTVSKAPLVPNTPLSFTDKNTARYLYAIDDRDGTVMVQSLSLDAKGELAGTPLLLPFSIAATRYGDRLPMPSGSALALDVIDTRDEEVLGVRQEEYEFTHPNPFIDPTTKKFVPGYYNDLTGSAPDNVKPDIATATKKAQDRVNKAQTAYDKARQDWDNNQNLMTETAWQAAAHELQNAARELDGWSLRGAYASTAAAYQMRGVFVVVSTAAGALFGIDVHDLDMFARAKQYCADDGAEGLTSDSDALPVMLRRHALRLGLGHDIAVSTSSGDLLDQVTCPDGYRALMSADGQNVPSPLYADGLVCTARDPWRSAADQWLFSYEGTFTGLIAGYLGPIATNKLDQAELFAPPGYDLCDHGVMARDLGRKNPMSSKAPGDVIALRTSPKTGVPGCNVPDAQDPQRFPILEAFRDHLVIGGTADEIKKLRQCYPDLIGFDLRASNEFVVGSTIGYQHNVTSDPADDTGHCVLDTMADPLRISRTFGAEPREDPMAKPPAVTHDKDGHIIEPSDVFQNQSIAVRIAAVARTRGTTAVMNIAQSIDYVHAAIYDSSQGRLDSLPVTVYFEPYTLDLYVVDTASQGLRRISITPFGGITSGFR